MGIIDKFQKSVFLFTNDLRLEDNRALIKAFEMSEEIIPVYVKIKNNSTENEFSQNLNQELKEKNSKLHVFNQNYEQVILKFIKQGVDAFFSSTAYSKDFKQVFEKIRKICLENKKTFSNFHNHLLHPILSVLGEDYEIPKNFEDFKKISQNLNIHPVLQNNHSNYYNQEIEGSETLNSMYLNLRNNVFKLLETEKDLKKLTPYLNNGIISPREVYFNTKSEELRNELYWREFLTHLNYQNPKFLKNFEEKKDLIFLG